MNKFDTNTAGTGEGAEPAGYQGSASSIHYRLAELEVENSRLHRLVAELLIKNQQLRKPD
jgi:hypothetical protein